MTKAELTRLRRGPGLSLLRTLPEQIADELGSAIVQGKLKGGHRLLEVEISAEYGVSRAPVREAIRLLARRRLVDFYPRRGAYVVDLTTEKIIDMFNVTAVLIGLAARYFAAMASEEQLDHLGEMIAQLEALAEKEPHYDPREFASTAWNMTTYFSRNCGSESIADLLDHQVNETAWGTLYRQMSADFVTQERRREAAAAFRRRYEAFRARDGDLADQISREMTYVSRGYVLAALTAVRGGEPPDERRLSI